MENFLRLSGFITVVAISRRASKKITDVGEINMSKII